MNRAIFPIHSFVTTFQLIDAPLIEILVGENAGSKYPSCLMLDGEKRSSMVVKYENHFSLLGRGGGEGGAGQKAEGVGGGANTNN